MIILIIIFFILPQSILCGFRSHAAILFNPIKEEILPYLFHLLFLFILLSTAHPQFTSDLQLLKLVLELWFLTLIFICCFQTLFFQLHFPFLLFFFIQHLISFFFPFDKLFQGRIGLTKRLCYFCQISLLLDEFVVLWFALSEIATADKAWHTLKKFPPL